MTYSIGIDSGSTATKGILLADGVITRRFLVPTPFRPATAITEAWETLREGLETGNVFFICEYRWRNYRSGNKGEKWGTICGGTSSRANCVLSANHL